MGKGGPGDQDRPRWASRQESGKSDLVTGLKTRIGKKATTVDFGTDFSVLSFFCFFFFFASERPSAPR